MHTGIDLTQLVECVCLVYKALGLTLLLYNTEGSWYTFVMSALGKGRQEGLCYIERVQGQCGIHKILSQTSNK